MTSVLRSKNGVPLSLSRSPQSAVSCADLTKVLELDPAAPPLLATPRRHRQRQHKGFLGSSVDGAAGTREHQLQGPMPKSRKRARTDGAADGGEYAEEYVWHQAL